MLRLSYSSLTTFNECPQKYKFQYIDKLPKRAKHFFSFGNSVHKALEYFYQGDMMPSLHLLLGSLDDHWISAGYKDVDAETKAKRDARRMLTAFHAKHSVNWRPALYTEYRFDFTVDWVRVTGAIDRIDLADGTMEVVDYKTGKPLDPARIAKDKQMLMYQIACKASCIEPVNKLTLYHVPTLKAHSIGPRSAADEEALKDEIVSVAQSINAGEFTAKPSEAACQWCDYKTVCPEWRR